MGLCRLFCTQLQGAPFIPWIMGIDCPGTEQCTACATTHGGPVDLYEVEAAANNCPKPLGLAGSLGSSQYGCFVAPKQMVFSFHCQTA